MKNFELILSDNGSSDDFDDKIRVLKNDREHKNLRVTKFEKRGQTWAIIKGIKAAKNNIIVTIDGNMKYELCHIEKLLEKYTDDTDMVVCKRQKRFHTDQNIIYPLCSLLANTVLRLCFKIECKDISSTYKIFDKKIIDNIPTKYYWSGLHRYLPLISTFQGSSNIKNICIDTKKRPFGKSNYTLFKYLWFPIDMINLLTLKRYLNKRITDRN